MRVYAHLDRKISKNDELVYKVAAESVEDYEEWIVAGIKFHSWESGKESKTLFSIYIYHFREGFKVVEVTCDTTQKNEIVLGFNASQVS
jgi:hypothetical protein